ncbi:hypothetical protein [Amycolatopsis sp. EV170708-02-1]|uniref:hypothetical protein n=1 Tax=Amycolatopsis sp. EV170708-02-1 TaxID=2919322 RepID=UPI001F0C6556|nr:hypothetical protein [Amycolatopsis sp. EV170708-02-1]UMP06733.1 hypothetical protein MJQ72_18825 [Amycolatopsis sp. EV170708-02-1]
MKADGVRQSSALRGRDKYLPERARSGNVGGYCPVPGTAQLRPVAMLNRRHAPCRSEIGGTAGSLQ